jgi:hypothetical protein
MGVAGWSKNLRSFKVSLVWNLAKGLIV